MYNSTKIYQGFAGDQQQLFATNMLTIYLIGYEQALSFNVLKQPMASCYSSALFDT